MDVDKLVEKWDRWVVDMARAHDPDEHDRLEQDSEALLAPLLTAPVVQLREFWNKLVETLKADPNVPFFIWRAAEEWTRIAIANAPDGKIVKLRRKLAGEVADLIDADPNTRKGLRDAMVRALMWRGDSDLKQTKENLEAGGRVKIKGRESCLFVETGRGKKRRTVML